MPPKHPPAGRLLLLAIGPLAVAALACLAVAGPPVARLSDSGPRVAAAVRAGYPELCHEWRDKVVARPSPASWYTSWEVSCVSGWGPYSYPLMTVNVVTCQWRAPLTMSLNWRKVLASITAASLPLRRCP